LCVGGENKNPDGTLSHTNLSVELWEKIYEKLFGGFEDLATTAFEDENEIDELENVPKEFKTKQGYLKDGFVVDDSGDETGSNSLGSSQDNDSDNLEDTSLSEQNSDSDSDSELSKDKYDYDDEN